MSRLLIAFSVFALWGSARFLRRVSTNGDVICGPDRGLRSPGAPTMLSWRSDSNHGGIDMNRKALLALMLGASFFISTAAQALCAGAMPPKPGSCPQCQVHCECDGYGNCRWVWR